MIAAEYLSGVDIRDEESTCIADVGGTRRGDAVERAYEVAACRWDAVIAFRDDRCKILKKEASRDASRIAVEMHRRLDGLRVPKSGLAAICSQTSEHGQARRREAGIGPTCNGYCSGTKPPDEGKLHCTSFDRQTAVAQRQLQPVNFKASQNERGARFVSVIDCTPDIALRALFEHKPTR